MPEEGDSKFKELKKASSKGSELKGKTLGLIGFGRIGQDTARIAAGVGMNVVAHDPFIPSADITVDVLGQDVTATINTVSKEEVLKQADFVSLHVPFKAGDTPVIGQPEIDIMKDGAGIVNCARGGAVDEKALLAALNSGKIAYAGLDVFEQEPPVYLDILKPDNVSLTPHIGAQTVEAQLRVGAELAENIISFYKK
jgi:D-3-phosphoglycerate dehydrogenase